MILRQRKGLSLAQEDDGRAYWVVTWETLFPRGLKKELEQ